MERLLRWIGSIATHRPKLVLWLALALTVVGGGLASQLRIATSRKALASEDEPNTKRYRAFAAEFGVPEDLIIVVKGQQPAEVRAFADAVAAALERDGADMIGGVFYKIDLSVFEKRAPLFVGLGAFDTLDALISDPAFDQLRRVEDPGRRLEALGGLLRKATSLGSDKEVDEARAKQMAEGLRSVSQDLRRFAVEGSRKLELFDRDALVRQAAEKGAAGGLDAEGYLTTDAGRTAVLSVRPSYRDDDVRNVRPFVAFVRKTAGEVAKSHSGVSFGLTGMPASIIDEQKSIRHDTKLTTAIAVIGVIFLFLIYFPTLRLLGFSLIPIVVGVAMTAGFIQLVYGYVNFISSIFLVVLIGMGIDYSVHLAARFVELRREEGLEPGEAARRSLEKAGAGIVTGGLTSAGAFFAVAFSGFRGIEELGMAASVGLMLTLIAALFIFPALLTLGGPKIPHKRQGFPGLGIWVTGVVKLRRPVLALAVVATVPMLWLSFKTPFDFSLLNLLPSGAESAMLMEEMVEKRELAGNASVAIADDIEAARVLEKKLRGLDGVYRVVSAATFLPSDQAEKLERIRHLAQVLEAKPEGASVDPLPISDGLEAYSGALERLQELAFQGGVKGVIDPLEEALSALEDVQDALEGDSAAQARAGVSAFTTELGALAAQAVDSIETSAAEGVFGPDDLPSNLRRLFVSSKGRFAVYAFPKTSIWDRQALEAFVGEVRSVEPNITGFPITFLEYTERLRSGFVNAALYASFAVLLLLWIDLRSLRFALLAGLPVTLGAIWMLGMMELASIPYNLANIFGLPLVIGVGIDNGVHLLHRFLQDRDVKQATVHTGGAVMLSSLTTMVGFGSLGFASHRGMGSLGIILFLGVGSCLFASMAVLPALLSGLDPQKKD